MTRRIDIAMQKKIKIFCPKLSSNDDMVLQIVRPGIMNSDMCEFSHASLLDPQSQLFDEAFRQNIRSGRWTCKIPPETFKTFGIDIIQDEKHDLNMFLDDVDVVLFHGSGVEKSYRYIAEQSKKFFPHAPIINVDYFDTPADRMHVRLNNMDQHNVYNFKRSMVDTNNGKINKFTHHIQHAAFCVREDIYTQQNKMYRPYNKREYDVTCFFPCNTKEKNINKMLNGQIDTPLHTRGWLASVVKYCHPGAYVGYTSGNQNKSPQKEGRGGMGLNTPGTTQYKYCDISTNSKIIVTACPTNYEGDYRLMEAMTSGALVMHNKMVLPPEGLVDGEHWIIYEDAIDLRDKMDYYIKNIGEAARIADAGRRFVLENHRPHHRVEQWLKEANIL